MIRLLLRGFLELVVTEDRPVGLEPLATAVLAVSEATAVLAVSEATAVLAVSEATAVLAVSEELAAMEESEATVVPADSFNHPRSPQPSLFPAV